MNEQLKDIEEKYSKAEIIEHINGIDIIAADKSDIDWFIERGQELEEDIEHYKKAIKNYKESFEECEVISQHDRHQNKRYREEIENIKEKTHQFDKETLIITVHERELLQALYYIETIINTVTDCGHENVQLDHDKYICKKCNEEVEPY